MKKFTKLFMPAVVAGVMSMGMATSAMAQELVLRGAVSAPLDTTWGIPFKMFVDRVNETGKGVVRIQAMGPEAIPAAEQANAIRSGLVDMVSIFPGSYKQMVPEANAHDVSNMSLEEQRASGGYEALNKLIMQKMNARMLTTYGPGVPFHLYLTRPISNINELKGLRVRSQPIFSAFFTELGLGTTTVPIPETYTALERGVVQGYGFAGWGVQDLGWDTLTKVRVEPGFYNVVLNVLMNEKRYRNLTAPQRKVIDDAVVWFEAHMKKYMAEQDKIQMAAQDKAGIKAVNLGPDFAKRAADAQWREMAKASPKNIPELRKLLEK